MKKRELQTSLAQRMTIQANDYHKAIKQANSIESGVRNWGAGIQIKRGR